MCMRPLPTSSSHSCSPRALGVLRHAVARLKPRQLVQRPGAARGRVGVRPGPLHKLACTAVTIWARIWPLAAAQPLLSACGSQSLGQGHQQAEMQGFVPELAGAARACAGVGEAESAELSDGE